MEKPKKQLTDKQTAFLEHLLGDARGNVRLAMDMAGYAKTTAQGWLVTSEGIVRLNHP